MPDDLVIATGTAACAVARDLARRLAAEKRKKLPRSASRRAARGGTGPNGRSAGESGTAAVIAFDIDGTQVYETNQPLDDLVPDWPLGTFHRLDPPGPDMVERIQAGMHRGRFENLNGEAVVSLKAIENASGGARTNGWLAAEINVAKIDGEIRRRFEAILTRPRVKSPGPDDRVRVILLAGTFGGLGSGSHDLIRRRVLAVARQMQIDIDFVCWHLVPATNASKDPDNSLALTYGVWRELAAQSTCFHWHREKRTGARPAELVRTAFVPTLVLSDTNNATGNPKALSIKGFTSMTAELLRTCLSTEIGARLHAQVGDFHIPSQQPTRTGEPRFGRSAGISVIHLDRERLFRYCVERLTERTLSRTLVPQDEESIERSVRVFLERHRLLEGEGVSQLSERLLERGEARHGALVDVERFRRILRGNVARLDAMGRLREAEGRIHLSLQQTGDIQLTLAARRQVVLRAASDDIVAQTDELARGRGSGIAAAKQWAEQACRVVENMVAEAVLDTVRFDTAVNKLQHRIEYYRRDYIPKVSRRSQMFLQLRPAPVEEEASRYVGVLEDLEIAKMRRAAHLAAIDTLRDVAACLRERLALTQAAVDAVTSVRDGALAEIARVADHRPDFECPVGLRLIEDRDDLESYFARLLADGGEDRAIEDVGLRLLGVDDPIGMAGDPARLRATLGPLVETAFRDRIAALHVVEELLRRFPGEEDLGAVLRERIRESFEYLQLRDSSDAENGLFLVRLLGIESNRAGDIEAIVSRHDYSRSVPFQCVDNADPERIVFVQFRAVFPFSDGAHFGRSREAYERASEAIPFEKYHVVPGERGLPTPGDPIGPTQARVLAFKAWVLGRLRFDSADSTWRLACADATEMPLALGADLEVLLGPEGYRRGVDIASHYACQFLARGPSPILAGLYRLLEIDRGRAKTIDETEARLAPLVDEDVRRSIEKEVDWWRKNTVPAAMEWGEPRSGDGEGARPRAVAPVAES